MLQKKKVILAAFGLMFCAQTTSAQMFSANTGFNKSFGNNSQNFQMVQTVRPSNDLLQKLSFCIKTTEEKMQQVDGTQVKVTYEVLGKAGGNCHYRVMVSSKYGTSSENCFFGIRTLQEYTNSLKKIYSYNLNEIKADAVPEELKKEIEAITQISGNKDICTIHINFDETKELREKLRTCAPYEKIMYKPSGNVLIKIVRREGNKCLVTYAITKKMQKISGLPQTAANKNLPDSAPRDTTMTFSCPLTQYNIEELRLSLEKSAIDATGIDALQEGDNNAHGELFSRFISDKICTVSKFTQ